MVHQTATYDVMAAIDQIAKARPDPTAGSPHMSREAPTR